MLKKQSLLLCLSVLTLFTSAQNPVSTHGALSVQGNKIVNDFGNPVSLAGASFFWSNTGWGGEEFYTSQAVSWLKNDWNCSVVRASMGVEDNGGYLGDASNKDKVKVIVDAAIAKGLYVIIDWHSHHAEDYQAEAIAFFEEMAGLYGEYPNIIYEIYNEPLQISWSSIIKPYSEAVISAIRAIDPDNLIIVGNSTWSQDVDIASNDPITGFENLAYTLHFYAGTHGQYLRDKALTALNNGIALFVTEWGTVNANGDGAVNAGEVDLWMDFLCEHDISHCNWAINDKNEGASALVQGASPNGSWSASDLTASGSLVRSIVKSWCGLNNATNNRIQGLEYGPNPFTESINIFREGSTEEYNYSILNISGQIISRGTLKAGEDNLRIGKELQSGIYFVELFNKNMSAVIKVVKNEE